MRPTFLLQTLAAVASIAVFVGALAIFGRGANLWVVGALLLLWLGGLELGFLPLLLEWLALRHARAGGGALRSAWFTYDAHEAETRERDRNKRDTQHNPSLW